MSTNTDTRVQTIENAHLDDVRPGDHITWVSVKEVGSVTVKSYREGIAHHRDKWGDWRTEDDVLLAQADAELGKGTTITIRRTVQDLPERAGAVIVPADGRERVEAMANVVWYANKAVLGPDNRWHGVWRAYPGRAINSVSPEHITPGTWKKADQ